MAAVPTLDKDQLAQERRSDFDVTNNVCVSSVRDVRRAVRELYEAEFRTAAFDASYAAMGVFEAVKAEVDAIRTTEPRRRGSMHRSAAWATKKTPLTLTAISSS